MLCAYAMAVGSVRASRRLFACLFGALVRAPMLFFDLTPKGRILNRVAEDVSSVDRVMPFTVRSMINCVLAGFASIFVVAFATPWFLISLPILALIYYYIQVKCCHLLRHVNAQALLAVDAYSNRFPVCWLAACYVIVTFYLHFLSIVSPICFPSADTNLH